MVKKVVMERYVWVLVLLVYGGILIIVIYWFRDGKVLGKWRGFWVNVYGWVCNRGGDDWVMNGVINRIGIGFIGGRV